MVFQPSISMMFNVVYRVETCIRAILEASWEFSSPHKRLMLEVTETEPIKNIEHLKTVFSEYPRKRLLTTTIDDFGAGYVGLNMLMQLQPYVIKIIAESIESESESAYLKNTKFHYQQGSLLARPVWETLAFRDIVGR